MKSTMFCGAMFAAVTFAAGSAQAFSYQFTDFITNNGVDGAEMTPSSTPVRQPIVTFTDVDPSTVRMEISFDAGDDFEYISSDLVGVFFDLGGGSFGTDLDHVTMEGDPGDTLIALEEYKSMGFTFMRDGEEFDPGEFGVALDLSAFGNPLLLNFDDGTATPLTDIITRVGLIYSQSPNGAPGSAYFSDTRSDVSAVPLPAAAPLLLGALAGLGFVARRRKV